MQNSVYNNNIKSGAPRAIPNVCNTCINVQSLLMGNGYKVSYPRWRQIHRRNQVTQPSNEYRVPALPTANVENGSMLMFVSLKKIDEHLRRLT